MMALLLNFSSLCLLLLISAILSSEAATDPNDALALHDLYNALKRPKQLKGWTAEGGDPCEQSWTGIECSGSSVVHIKLHGLELEGYLSGQLFNLHSLKHLDMSSNRISGMIPDGLPPNVTYLNLAENSFLLSIPQTLSFLKNLRYLNLSHNNLSGPIGSVFKGLDSLKEMDLSYNKLNGDLPSSFTSLTNLTNLYLQNNELTGSVVYLADLALTKLNIQNNPFDGVIPEQFQTIPYLWIGGNNFSRVASYSPWNFPFNKVSSEQNISSPPIADKNISSSPIIADQNVSSPPIVQNTSSPPIAGLSTMEKNPSRGTQQQHKRKGIKALAAGIAAAILIVLGLAVILNVPALLWKRLYIADPESLNTSRRSMRSFPVSSNGGNVIERVGVKKLSPPLLVYSRRPKQGQGKVN